MVLELEQERGGALRPKKAEATVRRGGVSLPSFSSTDELISTTLGDFSLAEVLPDKNPNPDMLVGMNLWSR